MVLAAAVRAPADLDGALSARHHRHQIRSRAEVLGEPAAEPARLGHRQTAALRARAAHDVAERVGVGGPEVRSRDPVVERPQALLLHPLEEHVLLHREPHGPVAVGLGQISQHAHLTRGHVAERQPHGHVAVAGLLLRCGVGLAPAHEGIVHGLQLHRAGHDARADDRRHRGRGHGVHRRCGHRLPVGGALRLQLLGREPEGRAAGGHERLQFLHHLGPERLPSELLDHELHPVALTVLVVAVLVEDADHGLGHVLDLLHRQELVEHVTAHRHDGSAAGNREPEAALAVLDSGAQADVVDRCERVILGAALERDLELARQHGGERMPQEVAGQRLGVGIDVEDLARRRAHVGAAGHVAHRVAARLARGQPFVAQDPHRVFAVLQQHEVQLDVLPRRHVAEAARVLRRHRGERAHLPAAHDALRRLHAQHLHAVLALAVGAARQAIAPPVVGSHLAAFELAEKVHELVDVLLAGKVHASTPDHPGFVNCGHTSPPVPRLPAGPSRPPFRRSCPRRRRAPPAR